MTLWEPIPPGSEVKDGLKVTEGQGVAEANRAMESEASAHAADCDDIQGYRAGAYRLLAALLRSIPDQALLDHVAALAEVDRETDELAAALSLLGQAASLGNADENSSNNENDTTDANSRLGAISDEFHALFIGLGRGELVPYGSWYLTGFLMEKPLGILRDDLAMLGFERNARTNEPEDHIAALCEVMSMMISQGMDQSPDEDIRGTEDAEVIQRRFFQAHVGPWAEHFFRDLSKSPTADFYRAVGQFGLVFTAFEKRYFSMDV